MESLLMSLSLQSRHRGRGLSPSLVPPLEGSDWFIKRSPHASEPDGINAGMALYLIHYRATGR